MPREDDDVALALRESPRPPLQENAYVSQARQSARPVGTEGDEGEGKQTQRRNVFFMLRLRCSIELQALSAIFLFFSFLLLRFVVFVRLCVLKLLR